MLFLIDSFAQFAVKWFLFFKPFSELSLLVNVTLTITIMLVHEWVAFGLEALVLLIKILFILLQVFKIFF